MKKYNFDIKTTKVQTPTGVQYHVDKINTGLDLAQYRKKVEPLFFRKSTLATEFEDKLVVFMDDGFCRSYLDSLTDEADDMIRDDIVGNCETVVKIQEGRVYPLEILKEVERYVLITLRRLEEESES